MTSQGQNAIPLKAVIIGASGKTNNKKNINKNY